MLSLGMHRQGCTDCIISAVMLGVMLCPSFLLVSALLQTHVPPADWCSLQGESVGMPQILDLRQILTESNTDLRQPIGLERQLLENCESSDGEVGLSMLQLLKVSLIESSS